MNIFVMNDKNLLTSETISNVIDVVKQGYVAPLTADKAGPIDEMGVINKDRKHAPCVKLLKQLKKGKVSEK